MDNVVKRFAGQQLLLGLFGAVGTGKSRVVDALRAWFARNRSIELVVTATTGTAAFNISGTTLDSWNTSDAIGVWEHKTLRCWNVDLKCVCQSFLFVNYLHVGCTCSMLVFCISSDGELFPWRDILDSRN